MAFVTLQIIDGFEKGRTFADLTTPVTLGREEDNSIQLNDERVSRFHAKIQEDGGRLILTDLDSTNGTRVNGHPIQMRVLQVGDQVSVGRSLLVYGDSAEIAALAKQRAESEVTPYNGQGNRTLAIPAKNPPITFGENGMATSNDDPRAELFPHGPPELPAELRPLQAAQLSDILAYVHEQIALVADAAAEEPGRAVMRVDWATWQKLLQLEMDLAVYLRSISDPK